MTLVHVHIGLGSEGRGVPYLSVMQWGVSIWSESATKPSVRRCKYSAVHRVGVVEMILLVVPHGLRHGLLLRVIDFHKHHIVFFIILGFSMQH